MHGQSIIYLLEDPRDGLIRYIGATKQPLMARLAGHVTMAWRGTTHPVCAWLRDLIAVELLPRTFVIDRVPVHLEGAAEQYWISYFSENDAPLLNQARRNHYMQHYLDWMEQRRQDDPAWLAKIGEPQVVTLWFPLGG